MAKIVKIKVKDKGTLTIKETKTTVTNYKITGVNPEFSIYDESWRRIRGNYKYKCTECFVCDTEFKEGDKIGVIFTNKGNKVVCNECGRNIEADMEQDK